MKLVLYFLITKILKPYSDELKLRTNFELYFEINLERNERKKWVQFANAQAKRTKFRPKNMLNNNVKCINKYYKTGGESKNN